MDLLETFNPFCQTGLQRKCMKKAESSATIPERFIRELNAALTFYDKPPTVLEIGSIV